MPRQTFTLAQGCGFFVSKDGYIVTNDRSSITRARSP